MRHARQPSRQDRGFVHGATGACFCYHLSLQCVRPQRTTSIRLHLINSRRSSLCSHVCDLNKSGSPWWWRMTCDLALKAAVPTGAVCSSAENQTQLSLECRFSSCVKMGVCSLAEV